MQPGILLTTHQHGTTTGEHWVEATPTANNMTRYVPRVWDPDAIVDSTWEPDLQQNTITLALGYFVLQKTIALANVFFEYILLHNYPKLSRKWCFVEDGATQSPLGRQQDLLKRVLCAMVLLARWPGWFYFHAHLWHCVSYGVLGFAALEFTAVGALLTLTLSLWLGSKLADLTGWEPLDEMYKEVRFDEKDLVTPNGKHMARKAPDSIGMGRFLSRFGDPQQEEESTKKGFWWETEKDQAGQDRLVVYQSISMKPAFWGNEVSFEELRLEYHANMAESLSSAPTPATDTTITQDKFEDSKQSTGGFKNNVGSSLPLWLKARPFRGSIFGSPKSSEQSLDTFGDSATDVQESEARGSTAGTSILFSTPDLLTGSPLRRRFI